MKRFAILAALVLAACSDPAKRAVDARVDTPIDSPSGSAARVGNDGIDPSPVDHSLELGVIAVSLVVAVGPVRARRRRNDTL